MLVYEVRDFVHVGGGGGGGGLLGSGEAEADAESGLANDVGGESKGEVGEGDVFSFFYLRGLEVLSGGFDEVLHGRDEAG